MRSISITLSSLDLSALLDDKLAVGLSAAGATSLNASKHVFAAGHLSENNVSTIEPVGGAESDEELGSVGSGASVGHAQLASLGVLDIKVLIGELGTVDGDSAGAVAVGEVTTLSHEVRDDSVERAALVGVLLSVIASAEGTEVLSGLRDHVGVELEQT